jgi:hypothetical protein
VLASRINVSTTLKQRNHLSFDSPNGGNIERTFTENANLVHICRERYLNPILSTSADCGKLGA